MPPETAEPPSGLAKLFELPEDNPVLQKAAETTDATEEFAPEPTPPPKPAEEKKPEPVAEKVEETKPNPITARLAPDFAAAKTEEKAKTVDDHPEITQEMIDGEKDPRKQASLRKLGKSLSDYKHQVADLSARIAASPKVDTESTALLEQVTKERDELLSRVERSNLLESPKFQKEHLEPRNKEFASAQSIVKDAGGDPAELQRAMALSGKARIELLDEIREKIPSEMMKGRFDRLIESIDNRTADINERLRNAKTEIETERRDDKVKSHEQAVQIERQIKGLLGSTRKDLLENHDWTYLKKTGNPDYKWWDDQVDEIDAVAHEIMLNSTPDKAAVAAYFAASAGPLHALLKSTQAALAASEKENAELRGVDPKMKRERKADSSKATPGDGIETEDILARMHAGSYQTRSS